MSGKVKYYDNSPAFLYIARKNAKAIDYIYKKLEKLYALEKSSSYYNSCSAEIDILEDLQEILEKEVK